MCVGTCVRGCMGVRVHECLLVSTPALTSVTYARMGNQNGLEFTFRYILVYDGAVRVQL